MKRYYGGEPVKRGVYLDLATLEFVQLRDEAPILPGGRKTQYIRAPGLLAVVAGPVAGLALVLFLPFVGLAGMVTFLSYKLVKGVQIVGGRIFNNAPAELQPDRAAPAVPEIKQKVEEKRRNGEQ